MHLIQRKKYQCRETAFQAIFLDRKIFGKKPPYKLILCLLANLILSGKHTGMCFAPFLRILSLWKPSSPISQSPLPAALPPVSRENLFLIDYIKESHLQHTKNEQCYVGLVANDIGTYLLVCSALLQNKVSFLQVWLTTFPVQKNNANQCCANWWDANLQLHFPAFLCCYTLRFTRANNRPMREKQN